MASDQALGGGRYPACPSRKPAWLPLRSPWRSTTKAGTNLTVRKTGPLCRVGGEEARSGSRLRRLASLPKGAVSEGVPRMEPPSQTS